MRPLGRDDLLPIEAFEALRPALRERVTAHKAPRRIAVGDRVTLVFEDRETLRWQVLEMCRVERIRDPAAVQHELDVYNELVPGENELSATLFVEITDRARIRQELDRLIGIDEHVSLEVGDARIAARFDPKQMEEERISAVQYVRFVLTPEQVARFEDPAVPVRLRVDHPNYTAEAVLVPAQRSALAIDLRGDPPPLLEPSELPATREPEVLRTRGRARAVRPLLPRGPGHVVVAATDEVSFAEASPEVLADVFALAQELAGDLLRRHGGCRLTVDAKARPLACDLLPGD